MHRSRIVLVFSILLALILCLSGCSSSGKDIPDISNTSQVTEDKFNEEVKQTNSLSSNSSETTEEQSDEISSELSEETSEMDQSNGESSSEEISEVNQSSEESPSEEAQPGSTEESSESEESVPEYVQEMAGVYSLFFYGDPIEEIVYNYDLLRHLQIANGFSPDALTLNIDGTGHINWLGNEADITWTEDTISLDGAECTIRFKDSKLTITTAEDKTLEFSKISHLERYNLSLEKEDLRTAVDVSFYEVGVPELFYYDGGGSKNYMTDELVNYMFVSIPIENKSDKLLFVDSLYFSTHSSDGKELGFFLLPAKKTLLPKEKSYLIFNYQVLGEELFLTGFATETSFPQNATLQIEEIDICECISDFQKYNAEITEIIFYEESTPSSLYMVYRANGSVELPEGADISQIQICVYCINKDGKIVGYGENQAVPSSVNSKVYFEEVPGEHKGVFQTNITGPINHIDFPKDTIDRYEIVVYSPYSF